MPRDEATLLDIVTAARLAIEFRGELDKDAFLADLKTKAAVVHELLVLGEAVKRLSSSFRSKVHEIPWSLIAGMRDVLIHHYDVVGPLKPFVPEEPT
jgi:uncharacterized protein with HEPN domain